jgi:asparagine synthase (glutamine-hydrolysing)
MCGIGGVMSADGATPAPHVLDALARALSHRGPDGQGRYVGPGIGLVHTRLAIIDPATGDQPLYGPDNAVLVANAEIYNYIELRREFPNARLATGSDCELALHVHGREKDAFAKSLRGMYAIALYDRQRETLHLSRDPFGIKPLYYAQTPSGCIFASEPEAILQTKAVPRRLWPSAAEELLQLQFTTGSATIFDGLKRVEPGETLTLRGGHVVERRRIAALPSHPEMFRSEDEALKALENALMDSIMVHQRSDVPYGMFLSGGIDSSALLACMARLNDEPVSAFTAGFPGTAAKDERALAQRLARRVGARHVEVEVTGEDFWSLLPKAVAAMDDPAADYAILPTYKLGAAAAHALKVVLCGEGGDELFAGYGRYRRLLRPFWLGGKAIRARGLLDGLGLLRNPSMQWRDGMLAAQSAIPSGYARLEAAQALDCADWLPNDLLTKVDRCLMAHGVEGRTPFLDPRVAEVAFRLPAGLKIRNGLGKHLLRLWLSQALPEAEPFSRKRGFSVPVAEWMRGRADELGARVSAQAGIGALCRPESVRRLFRSLDSASKRTAHAAWLLLFYALWHRIHIEEAGPEGDILEVLKPA